MTDQETKDCIAQAIQAHYNDCHKPRKARNSDYTEDFEEFWSKFVGRWNVEKGRCFKGGKHDAWKAWISRGVDKLSQADKDNAIKFAHRTGQKYVKDACRWLKGKRWTDYEVIKKPVVAPKKTETVPPGKIIGLAERQKIRDMFGGKWLKGIK